MVTATITPFLSGLSSAEVFFTGFGSDVAFHTLTRIAAGRRQPVRGGVAIAPDVPVRDYEIEPSVPVVYETAMFDVDGVPLGTFQSAPVTMWFDSFIHQPLDPALWVAPHAILAGTAETITRDTPHESVYVEDASVARRIGSRRRGIDGLKFSFLTDEAGADMFSSMLGSYDSRQVGVLCIRTPSPMRIPRTFFASVSDVTEVEVDVHMGGDSVRIEFTATETTSPFAGLVKPTLTYDDLDAAYSSYDYRDAAYDMYTDMDRDYSLAGYAS